MPQDNTVMMEGVRITFRNFSGRVTPYNADGDRSFLVVISEEVGEALAADGWNVKRLEPKEEDEGDEGTLVLPCFLKYHGRNGPLHPPLVSIFSPSTGKRTNLTEEMVEELDFADILNVDVIVRPYPWEFNGKTGIKAMVKTLFVTIEEDPLVAKYQAMAEQAQQQ